MDSLMETAKAVGKADAIALAHHQGDQAETVTLLHAARGSDVRGLCAMRARRCGHHPSAVDVYAGTAPRRSSASIGQPWREDETNVCRQGLREEPQPPPCRASGAGGGVSRCKAGRRWRGWLRSAQRDEDYFFRKAWRAGG
ncbi:MAG: ATP-binding protein [Christensenellales bacterium]